MENSNEKLNLLFGLFLLGSHPLILLVEEILWKLVDQFLKLSLLLLPASLVVVVWLMNGVPLLSLKLNEAFRSALKLEIVRLDCMIRTLVVFVDI